MMTLSPLALPPCAQNLIPGLNERPVIADIPMREFDVSLPVLEKTQKEAHQESGSTAAVAEGGDADDATSGTGKGKPTIAGSVLLKAQNDWAPDEPEGEDSQPSQHAFPCLALPCLASSKSAHKKAI